MQTELIYLWINQDTNHCFHQIGFNFSPVFNISFDSIQRKLHIEKMDKPNIFSQNNLMNITAIIGENGTGKTTFLQFLTSLSDTPIGDAIPGYEAWNAAQNEYKKFVAIYYERSENENENIKIINKTDVSIFIDGTDIPPYSIENFQQENYIGHISHVYLSNSEYLEDSNLRLDSIDYITLSNGSIKSIFTSLYERLYNVPRKRIVDTQFNALQSIILNKMTSQSSQMILDLMYQNFIKISGTGFSGKCIGLISISITDILKLIPEEDQKINYQTEYASQPFIEEFHRKSEGELCKINPRRGIREKLVLNLLCELVFVYDFGLIGEGLSIDSVYDQCQRHIGEIQDYLQKAYYMSAIREIDGIRAFMVEETIIDNSLPNNDLNKQECVKISVERLWNIVNKSIELGHSFILKYLHIQNFEMSSGERALLNFMSRIYFASQIDNMIPDNGFMLHKNILLLIDEIDLYLHPEWQRRLISDLLHELTKHFPENYFQIVLTSHSPIVLSDIPRENSIFLKRIDGQIVQIKRDLQTFGANIHVLYKDAFFIKNGLAMGEYAQQYINQLATDIKEERITEEEANKKIATIGEPIIRKKLKLMLEHPQPELLPMKETEKQQLIDFLKRQKLDIEQQLSWLERR